MNAILASGTATVSSGETFAFWILAALTVIGALGMLWTLKATAGEPLDELAGV